MLIEKKYVFKIIKIYDSRIDHIIGNVKIIIEAIAVSLPKIAFKDK